MNTHLTEKSSNKKVVGTTKDGFQLKAVTTTTKESCPDSCQHKQNGSCYAMAGWHLNMHWDKVTKQERGTEFKTFAKQLEKALSDNEPFRHNQAGDLLGYADNPANSIDSEALENRYETYRSPGNHFILPTLGILRLKPESYCCIFSKNVSEKVGSRSRYSG